MRRMASAAAEKKCPRLFQFWACSASSKRRYASWTRAVAWRVCPGFSLASFWAASLRSSSYTSGSSCSAACGSPCSIADRMRVTSLIGYTSQTGVRNDMSVAARKAGG